MNNSQPKKSARSGGIFIAIGMIGGAFTGIYFGQPSAGMIVGLGIGSMIALAIWLYDRKNGL